MAVVVNSIKCMSWGWFLPHIGDEVGKTMEPPFTDADASTTVILVAWGFVLIAAALHFPPRCHFRGEFFGEASAKKAEISSGHDTRSFHERVSWKDRPGLSNSPADPPILTQPTPIC
jgi:hypothetical protein